MLTLLAVPIGIVGLISLIRACLREYELSIGVANRLEFLEELVYLERLSLERKERLRSVHASPSSNPVKFYEETRRKAAA